MSKNSLVLFTVILMTFMFFNGHIEAESEMGVGDKYPDNSHKELDSVDDFYESLSSHQYKEFENAKINIREKVFFEDVNKVLSRVDKYGGSRMRSDVINSNRQMYVLIPISENGKHQWLTVFDAETKNKMIQTKD